ncbi:MAG: DUF6482 family protein [Pseudomonadales bacterium]|nr:DUF6482 family protein [Pseudomonadales bacterium]
MKIALSQLMTMQPLQKVVIHSLDCALYQVSIVQDLCEFFVTDDKGKMLRTHSISDMQRFFLGLEVESMALRQQSAYDEMIGQPIKEDSNALEVPLAVKHAVL